MSAQPLEWNDLYFVLAVCREGTLSGAARTLSVNHSTVFRRIIAIEKKLGVRLFEKLSTGYVMTEAGEAMLEVGERVENEMLGLSRRLIGRDFQLSGTLRIAVPDALLVKILMSHLNIFSQRFPEIQLEIVISNNDLNLSKREADIAIRATRSPPETAVGRRVCEMKTTIYGSIDYLSKRTVETIENYAWLMPDEDLARLPITELLQRKYPKAAVSLRCNSLLGLYEAAIQGFGVVALPCFLADPDTRLNRIVEPPSELTTELWLLTHPDLRRTARVKALMDFLVEVLEKEKDLIEGQLIV
ncbi:Transcriptional regulator, LysR family [hydrothermal vent metagenome]|uniref:Transcriptional regulator, LysR family n=1 Tax=hydrothermal vent metagenome TaxID=652676 RepID=A0A3B0YEK2_9ZZZZ